MSKKKPHWSAILDVLKACPEGRRYARKKRSLDTAWRNCTNGSWMRWLACALTNLEYGSNAVMMYRGVRLATSSKAECYWLFQGFEKEDADLIRKLWPKPPRIPKKLLKEAGLI